MQLLAGRRGILDALGFTIQLSNAEIGDRSWAHATVVSYLRRLRYIYYHCGAVCWIYYANWKPFTLCLRDNFCVTLCLVFVTLVHLQNAETR